MIVLLSVWLLANALSAQTSSNLTPLELDTAIERPLFRGEEHLYQLSLAKDEYVSVTVEQHGVDVVVETRRCDGTVIADFQEEIGRQGREQVELVADADDVYTLAIRRGLGPLEPGSYAIRIESRRAATDADRALQEARALRTTGSTLELAARLDAARSKFERALSIVERLRGPDDPFVGRMLFDLGGNAIERRDDVTAASLYRRAIEIF